MIDRPAILKSVTQEHLKFHDEPRSPLIGPRYVMLGSELLPGAELYITMRSYGAGSLPDESNVSAHVHDTRQIFLLLGEQDSLHAWVSLDGQKSHVTSPALIWVPAGIMHALQVIKGPGIALSILERGTYA